MDSQYVSRTLGRCLSEALAELIELRPLDPIEFLALWIRKYKHNQELELQRAAHQRELEEEESRIRAAAQHVPESADESKPDLREDERESAADPPERASEPQDQEDQTSESLNPEEELHPEDSPSAGNEADDPPEEKTEDDTTEGPMERSAGNEADAPPEEKTEEDTTERPMEREEDEEDDRA
ncbi:DPY30 domain containing 2 isoform X2 [Pimephales promelas]|uniref:DPY30 domain containing 2 isoform X2 n=1 Tax=Pimephales promelas TaxID=90988 RepID=UPI001955E9A7|nr:DPY30 domain containing 2 isoform X2 [Pimephales promelas]